jgi:hypothetical protein
MITRSLVADDALQLRLDARLWPLVERWMPRGLSRPAGGGPAQATIELMIANMPLLEPAAPPLLRLDRVRAWSEDQRAVMLRGGLPASGGLVSLEAGHARLYVDRIQSPEADADVYSMLTISAALLLASLGRALVHAAAVVDPLGAAWLLAGDSRAGKSTTCATLAIAGWAYLSDDQVVLATDAAGEVRVEGWLRPFHLDSPPAPPAPPAPSQGQEPTGERREVLPSELGLHRWQRSARLGGVILPVVIPSKPTELRSLRPADALGGLVRQSPWLLACPHSAPRVLGLLERAVSAGGGTYRLELGRDTFHRPEELVRCVRALGTASPVRTSEAPRLVW